MFLALKFLFYMEALTFIGLFALRHCLAADARKLIDNKLVALAALLPAVGCLCRSVVLLYVLLVGITAFSSRRRSDVASTWIFLLPLLPALISPLLLGSTYLMRVSTILAINLGGAIGILVARREPGLKTLGALGPAAILTLLFIYIDGRELNATSLLRVVINAALIYLPPALIVAAGVTSPAALAKFLTRLVAAAFLCSTVAMFEAIRSWPLYDSLYTFLRVDAPSLSATLNVRAGFLRAPGPMGDPSSLGLFLAVALCAALAQRPSFRPRYHPYVVAWIGLGTLATQSRGAIVAALAGICVVQIYRRRTGLAVPLIAAAGAAKLLLDMIVPQSGRLADILGKSGQGSVTADYRLDLFHRGLQEIALHPFRGQPPTVLVDRMSNLLQGQHIVDFVNGHLFVAMAAGLGGFAVWLLVWLIPLFRAFAARPKRPRPRSLAVDAVPGMIVTAFVALTFTSIVDRNLIWAIVAFGLLRPAIIFARAAQPDRPPTPSARAEPKRGTAHLLGDRQPA